MYGHYKIDPIGALVQSIILINLYILLVINAIQVIYTGTYVLNNSEIGLQLLIISVFKKILSYLEIFRSNWFILYCFPKYKC